MSAKTRIVVLHLKELIYTGIFVALGILFIVLLFIMFRPDKDADANGSGKDDSPATENETETETESYSPGVYKSAISLNGETLEITVTTAEDHIESVVLGELSDNISATYPLLATTFEDVQTQLCSGTAITDITSSDDTHYTSALIVDAISVSLDAARVK